MARPRRPRQIRCDPAANYFKPRGIPLRLLEEIILELDEVEAIRLADGEGLYQEQAARQMGVSRQTFGNTLNAAHRKLADALLHGKALRIAGALPGGAFPSRRGGGIISKTQLNSESPS
jgi:uncharacterized protein